MKSRHNDYHFSFENTQSITETKLLKTVIRGGLFTEYDTWERNIESRGGVAYSWIEKLSTGLIHRCIATTAAVEWHCHIPTWFCIAIDLRRRLF
jgi:hypothetical protein